MRTCVLAIGVLVACAGTSPPPAPPTGDRALVAGLGPTHDAGAEPLVARPAEYAWYVVGTAYYDPSTYVPVTGATQALYLGTCQTVCSDQGLQAGARCEGWGPTYGLACRKTMTADKLASANSACGETQLYSQLGADYCCCGG